MVNINGNRKFFVEEKKIGSGGYGSVFLCKHVINGVELGTYAVKKVPVNALIIVQNLIFVFPQVGDNAPWLQKVLREVKALVALKKHPNIINYAHSWLEYGQCANFGICEIQFQL